MRILNIRFKNLNSLAGEWAIDLTHPAFTADGIFAITGPTGAGKTTILDAICLALYGRTPRLNKVTKSGNEIMSRQTGECYAEVTFETQVGRYRCHWSQHRSRRKSGGELQPPKHEIADADSGKILQTKIFDVGKKIEKVTGMDFDRFTRSMLLAQGGFAVFLQADPDARAPILEQITGTEIYSLISIRVHERRSDERKKLDQLQAELAGMQLLTPEDEQQLGISLQRKTQQDQEINQHIARKNQAITWAEGIARVEQELQRLGQQKNDLQLRMEAFMPDQERLRLANQALELVGDYTALTAIRREQQTDRRILGECRESLPNCEEAARLAEVIMKGAAEQLETKKAEQQKVLPIIRKARELDLKIAEKDAPIEAANNFIAEISASVEMLGSKQHGDCADLDSKRKALEDLQQQLEASKADQGLQEQFTGIQSRFEALRNLHAQLLAKGDEIKQADSQLQDVSRIWQQQSSILDKQKRDLEGIQIQQSEKQAELENILENQALADWRKSQSLLSAERILVTKALEAAQSLSQSMQAVVEGDKRKATLIADEVALTSQLQSQSEQQAGLEKQIELLETQLILMKKIEDLEEARHQLQDGEPCPLCGAKEHPFAAGNVPFPDETGHQLVAVRGVFKSVTDAISDLKVKLAKVSKDLEQVASTQKEHAEKIAQVNCVLGEVFTELSPDLKLIASDPGLDEKLKTLQQRNAQALAHATNTLESAETVEKVLNALRELRDKAKESVAKAERETQAAAHKKESAIQLLQRLQKEADGHRDQQHKSLELLQQEAQVFTVETLSIENLDVVLEQLSSRRDRWIARQNEKTELEQKIAALVMQTHHQAEQIQKSETELKKQQLQLDGLYRERDAFVRERQDVFGKLEPDAEESHLSAAIDSADKELDAARRKLATANQEFSQLKFRIEVLLKAIATRDIQLTTSEDAFQLRLQESGFADEENYQSACLPESERKHLTQQSQTLIVENTELLSQEREKTKLLQTERQQQITEEPLQSLKNAVAILLTELKQLQHEIGGIGQKLKDNETLKQQQQQRLQAIDAQKRECVRWEQLHQLIGSADGKKYRNFAQGLTFEMMIGHANQQLRQMSDRYLLIRDNAQPLELNVIDNYQAGEIRSTKNLSGGESFIVSLSLALGLSHMASKNVRVDSLFLDEGFGTLDEEALDTALETLAGLQQDGKLIGVISHVPALKERISTQIQVKLQTGGRSRLSGPGCEGS